MPYRSIRWFRFPMFLLALGLIVFEALPVVAGNASGPGQAPLNNFMKVFMNVPAQDLEECLRVSTQFDPWPVAEKQAATLDALGKRLFEAHQAVLQPLLARARDLLAEPLPQMSPKQFEDLRSSTPLPDLRFCLGLAQMFRLMAFHRHRAQDDQTALGLLTLSYRFGQIMGAGDGAPPQLIVSLTGLAIRKASWSEPAGTILRQGDLPADTLLQTASLLDQARKEELPFLRTIDTEFKLLQNALKYEMLATPTAGSNPEETFGPPYKAVDPIRALPPREQKEMVDTILARLEARQKEYQTIANRLPEDFPANRKALEAFVEKAHADAQPGLSSFLDVPGSIANILFSSPLPGFTTFYAQMVEGDLRVHGVVLLCRLMAGLKNGGKMPTDRPTFEALVGESVPADPFAGPGAFCRVSTGSGTVLLFSVGQDGRDDAGDPGKDLILLRVDAR